MRRKVIISAIVIILMFCIGAIISACDNTKGKNGAELPAPVIALQENTISWNAVPNADGYEVYEGAEMVSAQTQTTYTISKTEAGEYTYSVKATCKDNNYKTSAFSNEVVYEVTENHAQLAAPVISLAENVISWNAVPHANIYVIYENDAEVGRQLTTSYTINRVEEGEYTYSVVAAGTANYAQSEHSNKVTYVVEALGEPTQLAAPEVSLAGNVLSWEAVPHASGYIVYENGDMVTRVTQTSFAIAQENVGEYTYTVCASSSNAQYLLSEPSNAVVYTVLPRPLAAPVVVRQGYLLTWEEVEHAAYYIVYESGIAVFRATIPGYSIPQENYGTFSFTVIAYPEEDSENYLPGEPSAAVEITVSDDREQLGTPVAQIETRAGTGEEAADITVLTWTEVTNAYGYEVYENDRRVRTTSDTEYVISQVMPGTYRYKVRAISDGEYKAGDFSNEESYVIAAENIYFTVIINLPSDYPTGGQISVGLFNQQRNLPIGNAVRTATIPIAMASDGARISALNDKTYIAKITSALTAGYYASEVRVSAENPSATINVYKKSDYGVVKLGNNSFTVVNGDGPTGNGVTQTGYLFVAPEAAQYYIAIVEGDDMNLWFVGDTEKCVLEPWQGLRQYAFAADKDEAIEISFAGHSVGTFTYRVVKGELKEQLLIGKGYGQGAVNVVVDGEKSAVRYLTLAEDTVFTFMFGTGNLGMRYVTITINGVNYYFDGLNNTQNIRIAAGTDIAIRITVSGVYDSTLSMNMAFYVYPIV